MNAVGSFADVVLVPLRARSGRTGVAQIEMRTVSGVGLVLPAYTSLRKLIACCGDEQPWMALDVDGVAEVRRVTGFDVIVHDLDLRGDKGQPEPPSSWLEVARP